MSDNNDPVVNLYQRLPRDEPSALIDARIRKQAKIQLHSSKSRKVVRWFSTAALLMLSLGVVLRIFQETPVQDELMTPDRFDAEPVLMSPAQMIPEERVLEEKPAARKKQQQQIEKLEKSSVINSTRTGVIKQSPNETKTAIDLPAKASTRSMPEVPQGFLLDGMAGSSDASESSLNDKIQYGPEQRQKALNTNWCGEPELANEYNRDIWEQKIKGVLAQQDTFKAACLTQLMNKRFNE